MNTYPTQREKLPIRNDIVSELIASVIIAILIILASFSGLIYNTELFSSQALKQTFFTNDLINLVIGVPSILIPVWLAWKGRLIGLLCLPGALLFVIYDYFIYLFSVPFNWQFPLYLLIISGSIYTIIFLSATTDGRAIKDIVQESLNYKLVGGILSILGIMSLIHAFTVVVYSLGRHSELTHLELGVQITDFIISPSWILGGLLLFNRNKFGYLTAIALLYNASLLFGGLIFLIIFRLFLTSNKVSLSDLLIISTMSLIYIIPFISSIHKICSLKNLTDQVHSPD